jgi:hypothetical protein
VVAVTGIAIAALVLAAAALGGLITFALKNSNARDERESARVRASSLNGELVVVRERLDRMIKDLASEQERSDALDDELATTYDHPDPAGARERLLQAWKLKHDVARGRAVKMSVPLRSDTPGNELIDPSTEDS